MIKMEMEKLLQWALREEMPKGHPVSASAWDTITRFALLGTRVDEGVHGGGDGLGFVPGEPHPDAVLIGDAVRRLPAEIKLTGAQCVALLGHYAPLDPLAIRAIAGSGFNPRALVIRCAILGERMPFDVGTPRAAPAVRRDRRKLAVAFVRDAEGILREASGNGRGNFPPGAATHIVWQEPSIGQVLEARAEYAVWWRALTMVHADLAGQNLRDYAALPPTSRAEPWRDGQAVAPPLHKSPVPPAAQVPLPISPARRRAGQKMTARERKRMMASQEAEPICADKVGAN